MSTLSPEATGFTTCWRVLLRVRVCVRMCVRERERGGGREREGKWEEDSGEEGDVAEHGGSFATVFARLRDNSLQGRKLHTSMCQRMGGETMWGAPGTKAQGRTW
jgi:hypothetical protein